MPKNVASESAVKRRNSKNLMPREDARGNSGRVAGGRSLQANVRMQTRASPQFAPSTRTYEVKHSSQSHSMLALKPPLVGIESESQNKTRTEINFNGDPLV